MTTSGSRIRFKVKKGSSHVITNDVEGVSAIGYRIANDSDEDLNLRVGTNGTMIIRKKTTMDYFRRLTNGSMELKSDSDTSQTGWYEFLGFQKLD